MPHSRWFKLLLLFITILVVSGAAYWYVTSRPLYRRNIEERAELQTMPPPQRGRKVMIFAPHEDDETLGCGGYIQQAVTAGSDLHVVMMTNGEFPEVDVVLFEHALHPAPEIFIRLGYMRQRETLAALKYLGVPSENVTFLGYPNQYLNQMWLPEHWLPDNPVQSIRTHSTRSPYNNSFTSDAIYCGQSVLQDVETLLSREKPDVVITIHPNDVHVDHWPTYAFVEFALNELAAQGEEFAHNCKVYTYLIHRDDWPEPQGYHPELPLEPPAGLVEVDETDWFALPLTDEQTVRKHKATKLYKTQAGSFDRLLLAFARTNDLFGAVPAHKWLSNNDNSSTVIKDPEDDLIASQKDPSSDIISVSFARKNDRMIVSIKTHGLASDQTNYHIAVHSGGAKAADRIITQYDWLDGKVVGQILQHGSLRNIPEDEIAAVVSGRIATIDIPWTFTDDNSFYMMQAWTGPGARTIDETAVTVFRK